ncbi:MAG: ABC transporter permease [Rickettsiaceae bacterium]|nr:ABC transporter permease [Rickettsiaceae bacterium]
MYYIALQMLFGNRAKYFAMVLGITFSAIIMTQQPAIFVGLLTRTYSFVSDISLPDIWVMDPGIQFVEENKPMRDVELIKVRGIDGVKWAVPMYKGLLRAKMPNGSQKSIDLTGLDNATLIGALYRILSGNLSDFRKANAIFVDINAINSRLMMKNSDGSPRRLEIGDVLEINDQRAVIVGLVKTTRNFVLQPQVYTTYSNALNYSFQSRKQLGYILVKAKEGQDPVELARRISRVTGLMSYTKNEFKTVNLNYWMNNTGIPINFGISVLLGFIVGAVIAGQTFYMFILENIKYYAVLKAMGVTNGMLVKLVLLQAVTVGFIGYGIGVGITTLFGLNLQDAILAFRLPPFLLLFAATGVLIIITLSALFGIRKVVTVDPMKVFRGDT